jgi:DNA polymerase (family X)
MKQARRFRRPGQVWVPVLHGQKGRWAYTALYPNAARAHELGKTRDWVVIYYESAGAAGQSGGHSGLRALKGRRVVRSREVECG